MPKNKRAQLTKTEGWSESAAARNFARSASKASLLVVPKAIRQ
jgi:hypothetical protein